MYCCSVINHSVCLSVCLYICLFVYPVVYLSVSLSVCLSVCHKGREFFAAFVTTVSKSRSQFFSFHCHVVLKKKISIILQRRNAKVILSGLDRLFDFDIQSQVQ